jgi:hypothetical protein
MGDVMLVECTSFHTLAALQLILYHVTELGWVFKPGEKLSDLLGRIVDDFTNSPGPLNTPETRQAMEDRYGVLSLPQLHHMCQCLLTARQLYPDQEIMGLKEDISRAYRRIRIRPVDCPLMIDLLPPTANGISYYAIRLSQPFGHNASGHAWGVVSQAILWHMEQALHPCRPSPTPPITGPLQDMYVDDLFAFGSQDYLQHASRAFHSAARVAGEGAVDEAKHGLSASLMSLGWAFFDRLDAVLPNPKGWFTLINLFFREVPWDLQRGHRLTNKLLMRLGSYASRYSRALLPLRAFTQGFHGNIGRGGSTMILRAVTAKTVQDLWMWRIVLRLAAQQPMLMATPPLWPVVHHLEPDQQAKMADIVVYVDACTSFHACGAYVEGDLCAQFVCPAPTHYVNSAVQQVHINYLEMMSVVGGALIVLNAHPDITHLHVWGDNTTSVSWAQTNRVLSPLACFFTQVLSLLGASRRVLITVGWVAGERNPWADALSRFFSVPDGPQYLSRLQDPKYRHLYPPQEFLDAITTVCRSSPLKTSTFTQCVRTTLGGTSSQRSVRSTS